jgi:hypothetical protein
MDFQKIHFARQQGVGVMKIAIYFGEKLILFSFRLKNKE